MIFTSHLFRQNTNGTISLEFKDNALENNGKSIPTNQLPTDTYIVNLIANGNMLDAKQLVIN